MKSVAHSVSPHLSDRKINDDFSPVSSFPPLLIFQPLLSSFFRSFSRFFFPPPPPPFARIQIRVCSSYHLLPPSLLPTLSIVVHRRGIPPSTYSLVSHTPLSSNWRGKSQPPPLRHSIRKKNDAAAWTSKIRRRRRRRRKRRNRLRIMLLLPTPPFPPTNAYFSRPPCPQPTHSAFPPSLPPSPAFSPPPSPP